MWVWGKRFEEWGQNGIKMVILNVKWRKYEWVNGCTHWSWLYMSVWRGNMGIDSINVVNNGQGFGQGGVGWWLDPIFGMMGGEVERK